MTGPQAKIPVFLELHGILVLHIAVEQSSPHPWAKQEILTGTCWPERSLHVKTFLLMLADFPTSIRNIRSMIYQWIHLILAKCLSVCHRVSHKSSTPPKEETTYEAHCRKSKIIAGMPQTLVGLMQVTCVWWWVADVCDWVCFCFVLHLTFSEMITFWSNPETSSGHVKISLFLGRGNVGLSRLGKKSPGHLSSFVFFFIGESQI